MAAAAVACGARAGSGTALAAPAAQQPRSFTNVLDLTHPLFEGFPTFDGSKWFTKEKMFTFAKEKLNINRWTLVEHTGTHMDAPLHFTTDGHSVDEIPVTDFVVPSRWWTSRKGPRTTPTPLSHPTTSEAGRLRTGRCRTAVAW